MSKKETLPKHEWKCALYNSPLKDGFYKCQVQSAWSLNIIQVEFKDGNWKYPLKVLQWEVPFSDSEIQYPISEIQSSISEIDLPEPAKSSKAYWKHRI